MKPNKEQLAILSELEMWAKKIKKETVRWEKEVNTVFRKEELLDYIGTAKDDWDDL